MFHSENSNTEHCSCNQGLYQSITWIRIPLSLPFLLQNTILFYLGFQFYLKISCHSLETILDHSPPQQEKANFFLGLVQIEKENIDRGKCVHCDKLPLQTPEYWAISMVRIIHTVKTTCWLHNIRTINTSLWSALRSISKPAQCEIACNKCRQLL